MKQLKFYWQKIKTAEPEELGRLLAFVVGLVLIMVGLILSCRKYFF